MRKTEKKTTRHHQTPTPRDPRTAISTPTTASTNSTAKTATDGSTMNSVSPTAILSLHSMTTRLRALTAAPPGNEENMDPALRASTSSIRRRQRTATPAPRLSAEPAKPTASSTANSVSDPEATSSSSDRAAEALEGWNQSTTRVDKLEREQVLTHELLNRMINTTNKQYDTTRELTALVQRNMAHQSGVNHSMIERTALARLESEKIQERDNLRHSIVMAMIQSLRPRSRDLPKIHVHTALYYDQPREEKLIQARVLVEYTEDGTGYISAYRVDGGYLTQLNYHEAPEGQEFNLRRSIIEDQMAQWKGGLQQDVSGHVTYDTCVALNPSGNTAQHFDCVCIAHLLSRRELSSDIHVSNQRCQSRRLGQETALVIGHELQTKAMKEMKSVKLAWTPERTITSNCVDCGAKIPTPVSSDDSEDEEETEHSSAGEKESMDCEEHSSLSDCEGNTTHESNEDADK